MKLNLKYRKKKKKNKKTRKKQHIKKIFESF